MYYITPQGTQTVWYCYSDGTITGCDLNGTRVVVETYFPVRTNTHEGRRAARSRLRRKPHVPDVHVTVLEIAMREPLRSMRWFALVARRN